MVQLQNYDEYVPWIIVLVGVQRHRGGRQRKYDYDIRSGIITAPYNNRRMMVAGAMAQSKSRIASHLV